MRERYDEARRLGARLSLSTIALFALRFGAANSDRAERNTRVLDALLGEGFDIVLFDMTDAAEAGAIRAHLRRAGTHISPHDILHRRRRLPARRDARRLKHARIRACARAVGRGLGRVREP